MEKDKKRIAYDYIKQQIISGALKSGAPIQEIQFSKLLGMSRSPIREALRELEAEGLVVSYPARGSFVVELTPYDIEEIFELRNLLESWALSRGFNRISESELDRMEKTVDEAFESNNWDNNHQADLMLHRMIDKSSGSKRLLSIMNSLNAQIERISYCSASNKERDAQTYQEHKDILNAIRERNLEKAKDALDKHLQNVSKAAIETAQII